VPPGASGEKTADGQRRRLRSGRPARAACQRRRGDPSTLLGEGVEEAEGDVTVLATVRRLGVSADVFVVTVGGPDKSVYLEAARTLVAAVRQLSDLAPRIIHSGGGGSLLDANRTRFVGSPEFPEAVRTDALGQAAGLDY
jgi:putative NADH-flavin reductase